MNNEFKKELVELLKKYPDVKEVHIKPQLAYDISVNETQTPLPLVSEPIKSEAQPNVFQQATNQVEETLNMLKKRAGITITENT